MSDLKELIKYIELLEAEPFTGWTGGNKKGYLTACTSIKKKAEKLLQEQANGADTSTDTALHKHIVSNNEVAVCCATCKHNTGRRNRYCRECDLFSKWKQTDC